MSTFYCEITVFFIFDLFLTIFCHKINEKATSEYRACLSQVLLYKFTHKDVYKTDLEATFTSWMPGGSVPYTPGGLAYRLQWGALRYAGRV